MALSLSWIAVILAMARLMGSPIGSPTVAVAVLAALGAWGWLMGRPGGRAALSKRMQLSNTLVLFAAGLSIALRPIPKSQSAGPADPASEARSQRIELRRQIADLYESGATEAERESLRRTYLERGREDLPHVVWLIAHGGPRTRRDMIAVAAAITGLPLEGGPDPVSDAAALAVVERLERYLAAGAATAPTTESRTAQTAESRTASTTESRTASTTRPQP